MPRRPRKLRWRRRRRRAPKCGQAHCLFIARCGRDAMAGALPLGSVMAPGHRPFIGAGRMEARANGTLKVEEGLPAYRKVCSRFSGCCSKQKGFVDRAAPGRA